MKTNTILFLSIVALASAGCDRTDNDWTIAKQVNTTSAYQEFLAKHPQGAHAEEAKSAIEAKEWNDAQAKGATEPSSYLDFHHKYPHSAYLTAVTADVECSQNLSISMGYGLSGTASMSSLNVDVNGRPDLSGEYRADESGAISLCKRYEELGGTIGKMKSANLLVANVNGKQRIVAVGAE